MLYGVLTVLNTVMMIQCLHMIINIWLKNVTTILDTGASSLGYAEYGCCRCSQVFYTISRYNIIYVVRKIFLIDMWVESIAFSLRYMINII